MVVFFPTSASRPYPGPAGEGEKTEKVVIGTKEVAGKLGNLKSSNCEGTPIAGCGAGGGRVWLLMQACMG